MKTMILALGLMAGAVVCNAQTKAPDVVSHSFAAMYPDTRMRTWARHGDMWIATFKDRDDKTKDMAYFKENGQWVKTETTIAAVKDLPNAIAMSWKKTDYGNWLVQNIKEVKLADRDVFVMKVAQPCSPNVSSAIDCKQPYNLYFDRNGTLLKESLVKNDNYLTSK